MAIEGGLGGYLWAGYLDFLAEGLDALLFPKHYERKEGGGGEMRADEKMKGIN